MSVRALTWSFTLPLQDMAAKAILHALADHADEEWKCWPSLERLALFAGCSESTARRALHRVEMLGIVARESRPGRSDMFRLNADWNPSQSDTPSILTPLSNEPVPLSTCNPTPSNLTGVGCQADTRTPIEPSKNPQSNRQRTRDDKPTRLPADWRPSQACRDFAADKGLDPDIVAEAFVDYWTGGKGGKQQRTDWDRTWRVWCGRDSARPVGGGQARPVRAARGNDAVYEQLARIAARSED